MSAALNILFNLSARVRHELSSEVKKQGFVLRVNFSEQNSTDFFVFFFYPLENSCTSTPPPSLLSPWSASPPVSVCGPDSGGTSAGSPAGDHGSLVGLMEQRKEYQLKGYKYLRAEIFNNIRVGGPGESSTHKMKVVA